MAPADKRVPTVIFTLVEAVLVWLSVQIWLAGDHTFALIFFTGLSAFAAILLVPGINPKKFRSQVSPSMQEALQKWWTEGTVTVELKDMTPKQIDQLFDDVVIRFGEIQISRFVTLPKVGLIASSKSVEDRSHFNVVLYRRDIAKQRGIKRPWRTHKSR